MLLHAMSVQCVIFRTAVDMEKKCSLYLANDFTHSKNVLSLVLFASLLSSILHLLPPGPHGFQERLAASQEAMKNKNVVNLGAIRQGMKRFQFLLNCCEPGTIPDASILAAALDLVCFRMY